MSRTRMKPFPSPKIPAFLASLGALLLLGACNVIPPAQDDPTRYFVLTDAPVAASHAAGTARIALHGVGLAGYLKNRQIVVRTGANEIEFRDYRLWAEPLDAAVGRVLRSSLIASPQVAQVLSDPLTIGQERDYDVTVTVVSCEGAVGAGGAFVARFGAVVEVWTGGNEPRVVSRRRFDAPDRAWDGRNFDALAGLLSQDAVALGEDIAANLPPKG